MFIIDSGKVLSRLKDLGFRSISDFAKSLGIHRNTIHYYLSGNAVLPQSLEKIIKALNLLPAEVLIEKKTNETMLPDEIAGLIDELHLKFPAITLILFGSRAKGKSHKYSDWDIGIYSSKNIDQETYRKILKMRDDFVENIPYSVDIVNLNRADANFLKEASNRWMFLNGLQKDWAEVNRKAAA